MSDYGLSDLVTNIGLTGDARSLKYIYEHAGGTGAGMQVTPLIPLNMWAKIRPGITASGKFKGITPRVITNIPADYNKTWEVDFTPPSDAIGPTRQLSHFCDLTNSKYYQHSTQPPVTGFEAHEYPQSVQAPDVIYNAAIDLMGNTYIHQLKASLLNFSLGGAERIGLEDILGSNGKFGFYALNTGGGHDFIHVCTVTIANNGKDFIFDIVPEAWPAGVYTIYPFFDVNGTRYSFPSSSVGVGSIEVKDVPSYPFTPLTGMDIKQSDGQVISQTTVNVPFSSGSFQLVAQTLVGTPPAAGAAANTTAIWSSRNTGIITIDQNGLCTFITAGQATIDLTGRQMAYGQIYTEKTNWVTINNVTIAITISPTTLEMGTGNNTSKQVTATVTPVGAFSHRIKYESSNTNVVTVTDGTSVESGLPVTINKVGVGTATITATSYADTSKKATATVNVRQGVTGIAITEASLILYTTSDPVTLHTNVQPNNAYNSAVAFSSSNTGVATVDANGKVTPQGVGTCTITGTTQDTYYSAQQYSDTVTVEIKNPATTQVGTRIDGYTGSVKVGRSVTLKIMAVYADGHAEDKTYANGWSGYTSIFSLSGVGTFTATAEGNATLTATYGGFSASIPVATYVVHVQGVSLNKSTTTIYIGSSETLIPTIIPADANDQRVTWSGDLANSFTVDQTGKVTATGPYEGVGDVTVTTVEGGYTASCLVTVSRIAVTGVTLSDSGATIAIGSTKTITATIAPSNATNKYLWWECSNTSVCTINRGGYTDPTLETTCTITAVGAGSATVTVHTSDGNKTAVCNVNVPAPAPTMTGIGIRGYSGAVNKGSSVTLQIVTVWSDGHEEDVTYANGWSGYTSIFSLSGGGTFTGIAGGSATLTATYGGYTTSIPVVCNVPPTGISLDKSSVTLAPGGSTTLKATIAPSDVSNTGVAWTRSNTKVSLSSASSTSGNNITITAGSSTGTCTITAKCAADNTKTATCTVTIAQATQSVDILDSNGDAVTGDIIDMVVSDTIQLTAYSDGTITSVNWSSSAVGVARVTGSTSTTCTIGARSAGTANITLKLNGDNNLTATVTIRVSNQPI